MSPKRLSPAVLAALGLSACVDGCDPADLPIVGTLFDDGDGDDGDNDGGDVGPCLSVADPNWVPPPPPDVPTGPCLQVVAPQPVVNPVPVHPCLRMAPPPPCLSPRLPDLGPCLTPRMPVSPCLSEVGPPPPVPAPPPGDQSGALPPSRTDVLARLDEAGLLPEDVRARLRGS